MNKYLFIMDPGHGWLRVPLAEVEAAEVDVSGYSYRDNEYAYLEEDCDAPRFMLKTGITHANITEEHQERTFVRSLPSYLDA